MDDAKAPEEVKAEDGEEEEPEPTPTV